MRIGFTSLLLLGGLPLVASAQDHAGHSEHAGKETREIKALAPDEVEDLLSGAGAGYALAAELNHFPGPRHVLELREELALSERQEEEVEAIFDDMKSRAIALGHRLVEAEAALDRAFRDGTMTGAALEELVSVAAELEGALRLVHLEAHLLTRAVLTPGQIDRYDELRGYAPPP